MSDNQFSPGTLEFVKKVHKAWGLIAKGATDEEVGQATGMDTGFAREMREIRRTVNDDPRMSHWDSDLD